MCHTAKGPYNELNTKQGSIIVNNPMDLICIDFAKMDPSKNVKEDVLIMMDTFLKFGVAVVTRIKVQKLSVKH